MLEITFDDSAGGSMIMARGQYPGFGNSLSLSFDMDLGDLHFGELSDYRFSQIRSWYKEDPWLGDGLFQEKDLIMNRKALAQVQEAAREGEKIRIWYDYSPHSICGYYHLISKIGHIDTDITAVCLQNHHELSLQNRRMGSADYRDFPELLSVEHPVQKEEREIITKKWDELCKESFPLRVYLNGHVIGVPIDFYDGLIRNSIPGEGEFRAVEIIKLVLAIPACPYSNVIEWRLSAILHSMPLKTSKLHRNEYHRYSWKLYRYSFMI